MCEILNKLAISDWISIGGIIVNLALAIWIVRVLQNNLTNQRYLKSHLIEEVKVIKDDYRNFLNKISAGRMRPKEVSPRLKLINIKIINLMNIIHSKYGIDKQHLTSYHANLRETITELKEYTSNYKSNRCFRLEYNSLETVIKFKQDNDTKFNDLIIKINDCK